MKRIAVLFTLVVLTSSGLSVARPSALPMPGGDEKETAYLPFADVMPEPVGGLPAIVKRIVYPDLARASRIEGKIYLVAYINEKGDVDDVKVIKGLPAGCDDAAMKAVKETKFSPGKQNGAAVKVQLSIPITFKIQ
ncbi:MAG TPA: energy transducer TonB [Bacteroidota bacterium]|nr:energy transducer TonB [Bacteroidota bacterium]